MRIKPKTAGQKVADTMTVEKFMNELHSSFVGKLFEGPNGEPDTILLMQKYLDEGRGSSLEQIMMGRAIAELIKLREEMANLTNPSTCFKMGVKEEADSTLYPKGDWRGMSRSSMTNGGDCLLSIENINKICREDEQNQLAEMLRLQEEANFNNEQFKNGNMK